MGPWVKTPYLVNIQKTSRNGYFRVFPPSQNRYLLGFDSLIGAPGQTGLGLCGGVSWLFRRIPIYKHLRHPEKNSKHTPMKPALGYLAIYRLVRFTSSRRYKVDGCTSKKPPCIHMYSTSKRPEHPSAVHVLRWIAT